jgi:ubiquinone/menaquinone biosynthesis C-methylase UbiE
VADLVDAYDRRPGSVLDLGCGTGALLRDLGHRTSRAGLSVGVDAAPRMAMAAANSVTGLATFVVTGRAEGLPFRDGVFDVVVSSLSFDHWSDQLQGLNECARVLRPSGHLLLVDLFSPWLWPTTLVGRRGRARTLRQATRLLRQAGFRGVGWRKLAPFVRAAVATP